QPPRQGFPAGIDLPAPAPGVADLLRLVEGGFAPAQRVLSHMAFVDVYSRPIPPNDVASLVVQRHGAGQKPAILTVRSAHAELMVDMSPGCPRLPPPDSARPNLARGGTLCRPRAGGMPS